MDKTYTVTVTPDMEILIRELPEEEEKQLEHLKQLVGGYIETIRSPRLNTLCIVNGEGKLLDLKPNMLATTICGMLGFDVIYGNAVFCVEDGEHIKGFT
jgi:hypothetical protein